ncbi:hypothetical protein Vretimale_15374 [Volvox reticuliferus]|uniref:Uncharacterized protein n=1 Tax=Volvox reticuliferus TaxID=1737510 RepID=A0A8J4CTS3_9CHLO|nr:hypothetical protein Vretifemale_16439 [Volvox reticuliferus]GIM11933.1 hypothetical protein Vretimale_15374 [Volvox reticuliferus]
MLWLAAACGFVFWEARRRRALKGRVVSGLDIQAVLNLTYEKSSSAYGASPSPNVGGFPLRQLKQELSILLDSPSANSDHLGSLIRDGENLLPDLCKLLQASRDAEVLADATELLALLSPSRRGLQAAICEAGAVPLLFRLLASAGTPVAINPHRRKWVGRDSLDGGPRIDNSARPKCQSTEYDQEKGRRLPRTTSSGTDIMRSENRSNNGSIGNRGVSSFVANPSGSGGNGSHGSSSSSSSSSSMTSHTISGQGLRAAVAADGGTEEGANGTVLDQVIMSNVLRTLVNLTSNARTGAPVRQAILRDASALDALLGLLLVPEEDAHGWRNGGGSGSGECEEEAREAVAAATNREWRTTPSSSRWHIAGLAAWLVAHLCSTPVGQLQLMQEGIVPALVWLVRRGRMAWTAAAAEERAALSCKRTARNELRSTAAAAAAAVADARRKPAGAGAEESRVAAAGADDRAAAAALPPTACGQVSYMSGGGVLPHVSSTLLYDAATVAAASNSSPHASAMPFMIAAVQYGLMALVNITFDNSSNQRAVAMSGMLAELEALFAALLQPGVLLLTPQAGVWAQGPSRLHEAHSEMIRAGSAEQMETAFANDDGANGDGIENGNDIGDDGGCNPPELELAMSLRIGYLGIAKFAVWLVAHLSSSDPDLKADIAGPIFSFVPRLLHFLMLPDLDSKVGITGEAVHGAAAATTTTTTARDVAATTASVIVVRQYAAMALVNLTCGVPSTKAAVARTMDWDGMAALLQWLAEETERVAAATTAADGARMQPPVTVTAAAASACGGSVSPPISDLLLYTVWLLQHLSLSPFAAAAADPRVISPLVALLDAPDAHVRLRASAAIGALCSASVPPTDGPRISGGPGAAISGGIAAASQPPPHRSAFLAAGGVQRLLVAARRERDPHLLAYAMLCLSSGVGDDVAAVAEAVGGGALALLEVLLTSEHPACLVPAAEALQGLARGARAGLRRHSSSDPAGATSLKRDDDVSVAATATTTTAAAAAAAAVLAAADHLPRSLLSRIVSVMLTHGDPSVRTAMNEALGALTALPGVRERYCAVFAETLRDLVNAAEVELQVIPVN